MTHSLPILTLGVTSAVLPPVVILVLCAVAGIGTVLLLPSRKEPSIRRIGGVILAVAGLILAALLTRAGGERAYFWIFSAIALIGAIRVVTHPRPVYSALYFVLTVFATAGLFVLLWAEFMAAALVLIYAGAILITYVFVIMLASSAQGGEQASPLAGLTEYDAVSRDPLTAAGVGFGMMAMLIFVIFDKAGGLPAASTTPVVGTAFALGKYLFTEQAVNLELAGVILTVAMVGAIVIARRRVESKDEAFDRTVETISTPATPESDDPHSIPVFGEKKLPPEKMYQETQA